MSQEPTSSFIPRYRPVADRAVLVEFDEVVGRKVHKYVRRLDAALGSKPFDGFTESVPAYTSLLIGFDPVRTSHEAVIVAVSKLINDGLPTLSKGARREILVCYDAEFAPDLPEVAAKTGLSCGEVIAAHLAGEYSVAMYGFAPGYAYMLGLPEAIQVPRKPNAVRAIPAGSLLIAGSQCLVSTLTMPTGWWIIGRSPNTILNDATDYPFLFSVGDHVKFRRIDREEFDVEEWRASL